MLSAPSLSEFLTEVELADLLKLTVGTIRDWRRLRRGPPYCKLGHTVRYRRDVVDDWLVASAVMPAAKNAEV
jgi:hypothetical protein